jgi:hypothetical protein
VEGTRYPALGSPFSTLARSKGSMVRAFLQIEGWCKYWPGPLGVEEYQRGRKAGIRPPAPHDLRRTWMGDPLEAGVDLATVQKMAGPASASTTAGYDRRDRGGAVRRAAALLHVPYTSLED